MKTQPSSKGNGFQELIVPLTSSPWAAEIRLSSEITLRLPEQRKRNLGLLTGNTRFLILPWVKAPHLASWTWAATLRNLSADWQSKYGHPVHLVLDDPVKTYPEVISFSKN